jgi:hypothetical protein
MQIATPRSIGIRMCKAFSAAITPIAAAKATTATVISSSGLVPLR